MEEARERTERERTERERIRSVLKAYTSKLEADTMKYDSYLKAASLCDRMERYSIAKDFLDKNRGYLDSPEAFAVSAQLIISIINKEDIQPPEKSFYNIDDTLKSKHLKTRDFEHLLLE